MTRPRPQLFDRLPEQYFTNLFATVRAAAARDREPLVDLARGNPELGPPPHVVERLAEVARDPDPRIHGYAPFSGLPALKDAVVARYRDVYGVDLDPEREVAVIPGTKTALVDLAVVLADTGETILLPDPGYPDYPSGVALAGARLEPLPLDADADFTPEWDRAPRADVAAVYLNYPSNPCGVTVRPGVFEESVRFAEATGAAIVHDFAYGDLVFDGRAPQSFLATPGAKDVGVEMFSMSKLYGMAGWRLGFVVGNAEIVARVDLLQDHHRAGIFAALQEAGIAALTGPQDTVEERRAAYERRRDRVVEALRGLLPREPTSEGTFYVWLELPDGVTPESLLTEHRVALAPGAGFGARGEGWARLSLAVTDETLAAGLDRFRLALA